MIKRVFYAFVFFLFLGSQIFAQEPTSKYVLVSTILSPKVLTSREAIHALVDFSKAASFHTLFIQIYRANQAWFPSVLADNTPYRDAVEKLGEDPFKLLIKEAQAAGVKVYAWMNLLSLSTNKDAVILQKYGTEILTRNREAKNSIEDYKVDNQYFLEPGDLRVWEYLTGVVEEIVTAYPSLDGLLFDYIRYPDVTPFYGYGAANIERFKKERQIETFAENNQEWHRWKREQVTGLLKRLTQKARGLKPSLSIIATGCVSYSRAYQDSFQDWPSWLNDGLVDFVGLMNYPIDVAEYKKYIDEAKAKVHDFKKVIIGLGAYKLMNDPDIFSEQLRIARESGGAGVMIFHYGNILENSKLMKHVIDYTGN